MNKNIFIKKSNILEMEIQMKARSLVPCPKILETISNDDDFYIVMEKLEGETIYELYGDDIKNVPDNIWKQIQAIISTLYYNEIHYVDITPFNFIVNKFNKVYIIDFGHAYECKINWFLKDFLDGYKSWNPDFK